ncbi:DNA polymerase III subunit epsilon [Isoalcanivorax pacificus W11-5]|uniref:DNA polymerase III subunit epsilon n=1 Tax=Isoalcanivorax pacificus W11-5 TaxID=391936 RepID=A0A0B4XJB2_9GAMM|nr:DNA polymerase III subunit epsilon [Isoalcanivorax pacificus]AJD48374.1 DNA polymerase III subunit epsilon [Isoalcanivorax pacificus W11-5]
MSRQIVLDTETTGLEPSEGHRVIEIGCVEMVGRRLTGNNLHLYLNPERDIDEGALQVHGITREFLADKPVFSAVAEDFLRFIDGAELVIHNAAFDVGFLNHELRRLGQDKPIEQRCKILDTLQLARAKHPGQKNNLDALCRRYGIDNFNRELHGALLDAQILAEVYLIMTGGQARLSLGGQDSNNSSGEASAEPIRRLAPDRPALKVIRASGDELAAHEAKLGGIARASEQGALWLQLEQDSAAEH